MGSVVPLNVAPIAASRGDAWTPAQIDQMRALSLARLEPLASKPTAAGHVVGSTRPHFSSGMAARTTSSRRPSARWPARWRAVEHGGAHAQYAHYRIKYEQRFGPLPALSGVPPLPEPVPEPAAADA